MNLIEDTNIEVLKCYKDVTDFKYLSKNTGSFIMLGLILSQIILINYMPKRMHYPS